MFYLCVFVLVFRITSWTHIPVLVKCLPLSQEL